MALVALQCLGQFHNPQHMYLDGRTGDGTVGLAPNTDEPYSGTHWEISGSLPLSSGTFTLFCDGDINSASYRFLDGNTFTGIVDLAPTTGGNFTGTVWKLNEVQVNSGIFTLQCLGRYHNPQHMYLDGHTGDGTLGLAPNTDEPYSGTRWLIGPVPQRIDDGTALNPVNG